VLVAGGHDGGSWVYQVAIFTAEGKLVADYIHPGWFFDMLIADINGDGVDEIILGGVNNGYREQNYGAALVVLDSRHVWGQGSVPPGDDRQARDRPSGTEAAALLIREFEPSQNAHWFCRIERITFAGGTIEVQVGQDPDSDLARAWFRFDKNLRLLGVQPELNFGGRLLTRFPKTLTFEKRRQVFVDELGHVKYLRNAFDPDFRDDAR
jgi:hypothetical protein